MRIFLTGATGYVGSAIADAALAAGHQVLALTRDASTRRNEERDGYLVVPGDLRSLGSLAQHAAAADAVIHAANTGGADAAAVDAAATRAMVAALAGSARPFLYTSGVWVLGATGAEAADEDAPTRPPAIVAWRARLEDWLRASARAARTVVVRPAIVYGDGGGIPGMMARGELPLVGDGTQLWPLVHRADLASLYLAALDRAEAGSTLHGVAHHRTAAEVGAAVCPQPEDLVRVTLAEARARLGSFADALALHQRVSARLTRERTGWTPRHSFAPHRQEAA